MRRWIPYRLLSLAAAIAMLACSDAEAPSAPSSGPEVSFSVASDAAKARHEALKEELDARKAYFKEMKEANKDALKTAKEEWKQWKHDWREQYKLEKEAWKRAHPGEKGGPEIQLLRCEPQGYQGDAAIVGPKGGTLHVGDHELVIPEGALEQDVLITAEAPTSSLVDVHFEPHGLQFQKPARLTLSYKHCVRPTNADFLIAYLGQGNQIWELPPSVDDKSSKDVEAEIDHFSRYAVAW
jgi:hypothetical protein